VEILIAAGADLNAQDITGMTALSWASIKGFPKIVGILISQGADAGTKSKDGKIALQFSKMTLANTQKAHSTAPAEDFPETQLKLKVKLGKYEKWSKSSKRRGARNKRSNPEEFGGADGFASPLFRVGLWEQAPNHLKLHRSRAVLLSFIEKTECPL